METLTIQTSIKDTMLRSDQSSTNYGGEPTMSAGRTPTGGVSRSLVEFAVAWGVDVPAGAEIRSATMTLRVMSRSKAAIYTVSRLLRADWMEYEATWDIYESGSPWTTAGCGSDGDDYDSTDAVGVTIEDTGDHSWNVTNLVKAAQAAGANPAFRIHGSVEDVTTYAYFASRESVITGYRPRLAIDYLIPPPVVPYVGLPYRVEVRDVDGHLIAIPRAVFSGQLTRSLNMPDGLSFQIAADDPACKYMTPRYELWVRDLSTGEIVSVCKAVMTEASDQ